MNPRSLRWRAYRLVRPIVRPVMHRLRTFLVGPLRDDIAGLRDEVRLLRTLLERQPQSIEAVVDQRTRHVMAQALATLALDRDARDEPDSP